MFSYGNDYPLLCIFLHLLLQGKVLYGQIFPFQAEESSATPEVLSVPVCLSVGKATVETGQQLGIKRKD